MKFFVTEVPVVTPGKRDYTATLTAYIPTNNLDLPLNRCRPAVVILPGGGYHHTSDAEAEPIALKLNAAGIAAFVLRYSCAPAVFPQALCEALWSVKFVRDRASEYGIHPHNIATMGFSAGGHLCASTGTLWNQPLLSEFLPGDLRDYRPDKNILGYALTFYESSHNGSFGNLLGEQLNEDALRTLNSLDLQVGAQNPPTFLWHTAADGCVDCKHSVRFAQCLVSAHIPTELHIYPHGSHGMGTGECTSRDIPIESPLTLHEWMDEAIRFLFDESLTKGASV